MGMKHVRAEDVKGNAVEMIGKEWMLISVKNGDAVNTMTASWGGLGVLWGKSVAFVFIRPQRYTYSFAENASEMTLSFLGEEYREALKYCGAHSGRDGDKFAAAGLTPVIDGDTVYPAEARLVYKGKKLYADDIKEACFTDPYPMYTYQAKDFHRMYVLEITDVLEKE